MNPTYLVLLCLSAIHVYWARGGTWPGHDASSLADKVIGRPPLPGPAACYLVAAALIVGPWLAPQLAAAAFAMRGVGGYFDHRLRPAIVGIEYHRLNQWLYSPLCLLLAVGLWGQ